MSSILWRLRHEMLDLRSTLPRSNMRNFSSETSSKTISLVGKWPLGLPACCLSFCLSVRTFEQSQKKPSCCCHSSASALLYLFTYLCIQWSVNHDKHNGLEVEG